jgi:hypothetical protein
MSGSHGNLSDGLIKHRVDHTSSIGNSVDNSHILSGDHETGTGGDSNHFGHGQNQFAFGDYGEDAGGYYRLMNFENDHV